MATQRMTQTALVRALAEAGETTNKQTRAILDKLSDLAVSEVKSNGVFVVPGIGRLVRVERQARMGRNPSTGASIEIPAKEVVKFRVAKAAKDAIVPAKPVKAAKSAKTAKTAAAPAKAAAAPAKAAKAAKAAKKK